MLLRPLTNMLLTLFRIVGWAKSPPPSTFFSLAASTNVCISPRNSLNFSFNPFATLVQNFKVIPSSSPKLLNLNQEHLSKKLVLIGQILVKLRL